MAITLRTVKGTSLTHAEMDTNFTEFFYSASVDGSQLKLHRFTADSASVPVPTNPSDGPDGFIQLSTGTAATSSFTHSLDFKLDRNTSTLYLTGSGNISGDLIVGGDITAERFLVEYVTSSVVFESGSTKFGNTADDTHDFTGTVDITRNLTANSISSSTDISGVNAILSKNLTANSVSSSTEISAIDGILSSNLTVNNISASTLISSSDSYIDDWNSISGSLSSLTSSITALSESVSATYLLNTTDSFTGTLTVTGSIIQSGSNSYFLNNVGVGTTNPTERLHVDGNLLVTGKVTAEEFHTELVSSSVVYKSGSTQFGDTSDDTHTFTGSLIVSGTIANTNIQENASTAFKTVMVDTTTGQFYYTGSYIGGAGTGIENVVEDTTPQLGGNLDLNSNNISGSGNIEIDGYISASGDIIAFASSDIRFKNDITPIANPIEKVLAIGGYEFDWNNLQGTYKGHDVGVIAQEVEKVLPEVVHTRPDGYKAVRYEKIVALLIEAIKEQQLQIDELKSKL